MSESTRRHDDPVLPGTEQAPVALDQAFGDPQHHYGIQDPEDTREQKERVGSLSRDALHELTRSTLFWVSAVLITFFMLMALFPGLFTNQDPNYCSLKFSLEGPQAGHWFGYNLQGCDVWSQTVYGARASIQVGIYVTILTTVIGAFIGILCGFYGGLTDSILSRTTDIFLALPILLGGMVFLTAVHLPGIWGVVCCLTLLGWPSSSRILRGEVISVKSADYVAAARALGAGNARIMRRHILPNAFTPLIVVAVISLGGYIAAEASLSYLGIGLQPPTISWGVMINDAASRVLQAPHMLLFPSIALSLTVLSFILMGEAVRTAFDPKLR